MSVDLLSGFGLRHGADRIALPPAPQRLVAFLALHRRSLAREYVAGVLWIDHDQDGANASLRTTLWRLKRLCQSVVTADAAEVALAPEVVVDVDCIVSITRRVGADGSCGIDEPQMRAIVDAGELLPDWYDDWIVIERERFRQIRLHALDALCTALARADRYGDALEVGLAAVAAEPLRESAHRAVIQAHLGEGNRVEAIRQYELCRRLLDDLGLEPSAQLGELVRCRAGDVPVTALV